MTRDRFRQINRRVKSTFGRPSRRLRLSQRRRAPRESQHRYLSRSRSPSTLVVSDWPAGIDPELPVGNVRFEERERAASTTRTLDYTDYVCNYCADDDTRNRRAPDVQNNVDLRS